MIASTRSGGPVVRTSNRPPSTSSSTSLEPNHFLSLSGRVIASHTRAIFLSSYEQSTFASIGSARMLEQRCELLRSLHVPGRPLVLANAWDAASAKAVVSAGFPVVATTSGGVAAALGYEDHQGAPAEGMLAAASRIVRSVDVPVTVDAEAGYGMAPGELVDALLRVGATGCNLEDTDHATHRQRELVDEAVTRARSYRAAGVDCVFPIFLHDADTVAAFVDAVQVPVNILALPQAPPIAQLAELRVARISYGSLIHQHAMQEVSAFLDRKSVV